VDPTQPIPWPNLVAALSVFFAAAGSAIGQTFNNRVRRKVVEEEKRKAAREAVELALAPVLRELRDAKARIAALERHVGWKPRAAHVEEKEPPP
jgi:hypothetical protein